MRRLEIDLGAIASNYKILKSLTNARVMAVAKGNAYGHGAIEIVKRLEAIGVDAVGVADIQEALQLRAAGCETELFCWLHGKDSDFAAAIANRIELGISSLAWLEKVEAAAKKVNSPAIVHLKVDTGLGRGGAPLTQWSDLVSQTLAMQERGQIELKGVFSHLSGTSKAEDLQQVKVFEAAIAAAEQLGANFELRHIASSLGTLLYPNSHFDMVRVGLAVYGHTPNSEISASDVGLRPALRVLSEVVQLKRVPKGQKVSYGYLYETDRETTLALVPFGYADGLPRVATGNAEVLVAGKRYPIRARIAMDQFVIDVGDDDIQLGDEVVIMGDGAKGEPTANELAKAAGSINYEVISRFGGRPKRIYI